MTSGTERRLTAAPHCIDHRRPVIDRQEMGSGNAARMGNIPLAESWASGLWQPSRWVS